MKITQQDIDRMNTRYKWYREDRFDRFLYGMVAGLFIALAIAAIGDYFHESAVKGYAEPVLAN